MTDIVQTVEDVANLALVRIGYHPLIQNIYEGSRGANAVLNVYAQTRDAVLREKDWGFAEAYTSLSGQQVGVGPWAFRYLYPTSCIRIRYITDSTHLADANDPRAVFYEVGFVGTQKWVFCNLSAPSAFYTQQITNPVLWDSMFVEALAAALARRIADGLGSPEVQKIEAVDEGETLERAGDIQG